jgi:hypothetical protein
MNTTVCIGGSGYTALRCQQRAVTAYRRDRPRIFAPDRFRAEMVDGQKSMRIYEATHAFIFKPYYGLLREERFADDGISANPSAIYWRQDYSA